jgi:queuine/archaeosine tRNA-ribosyltransferase
MSNFSKDFVFYCAGADNRVLSGGNVEALLLNVPHSTRSEKAIQNSMNFIQASGAKTIMLDSGGYELLRSQEKGMAISHDQNAPIFHSGRFNITPRHVVKAAETLKPHILVALDFPIRKFQGREEQEKEFLSKLNLNVAWAIQTAELREKYCPKIKLFLPVQCYGFNHLDIFFRRVEGIHFDGVSMPVRNLSLKEISLFLLRFHHMGIRRVHLLGTSAFFTIVLCAFMANRFFDSISLDSTTWNKAAELGRYLNPDLTRTWIVDDGETSEEEQIGCKCPVCFGRDFGYVKKLPSKEQVNYLHVHNYWMTRRFFRDSFKNSRSLESVDRFLKRTCSNTKKSHTLIQCLKELENGGIS